MIRKLLQILSFLAVLSSCGDDVDFRIKGNMENLKDEKIYAVFENSNGQDIDTVICEKPGEFIIEKKAGDFERVTLLWNDKRSWVIVFLEKGKNVHISGNALYPELLQVKGGKLNEALCEMYKGSANIWRERTDLLRSLDTPGISSIDRSDIMARIANVNLQIDETIIAYIKKHPDKNVSLILAQLYYMNPDHIRYLDMALDATNPFFAENPMYKDLQEYSNRHKRADIGSYAPDFSIKNIYGEIVSLDSLKAKDILLVFMDSWADIYSTKKDVLESFTNEFSDNYEVVMLSLDTEPKEVRNLIGKSTDHWNLVVDSAGQSSQLLDLYNISSLPRFFLIDKEHKIKEITDSESELRKKIENL